MVNHNHQNDFSLWSFWRPRCTIMYADACQLFPESVYILETMETMVTAMVKVKIFLETMAYNHVRRCMPIVSKVKIFLVTMAYNHVRRCMPIVSKVKIFLVTMAYNHVRRWMPKREQRSCSRGDIVASKVKSFW